MKSYLFIILSMLLSVVGMPLLAQEYLPGDTDASAEPAPEIFITLTNSGTEQYDILFPQPSGMVYRMTVDATYTLDMVQRLLRVYAAKHSKDYYWGDNPLAQASTLDGWTLHPNQTIPELLGISPDGELFYIRSPHQIPSDTVAPLGDTDYTETTVDSPAVSEAATLPPPDADAASNALGSVLAIPVKRCPQFLNHFHIQAAARKMVLDEGALKEMDSADMVDAVELSCGSQLAAPERGDWSGSVIYVGFYAPLLKLTNGAVSLYLHRVNGTDINQLLQEYDDNSPEVAQRIWSPVRDWLTLPESAELITDDVIELEYPQLVFDFCSTPSLCSTDFPLHGWRNANGGLDYLDAGSDEQLFIEAQMAINGATQRRIKRHRTDDTGAFRVNDLGWELAHCTVGPKWEDALGLPEVTAQPKGFARAWEDAYNNDAALQLAAKHLPCPIENRCVVEIPNNYWGEFNLGDYDLANEVRRSCQNGEGVLRIVVKEDITSKSRPLRISPERFSEANRQTIHTVEIVGATSDTQIVAEHEDWYTYQSPIPVFELDGELTFSIEHLNFLPKKSDTSDDTPIRAINRSVLEVTGGANVRVEHVTVDTQQTNNDVSDATQTTSNGTMFYSGISATDSTVVLYKTGVKTFTRAIDGRRTKLAIVGDRIVSAKSSVVATLPFADIDRSLLKDLKGRSLVSNSKAFSAIRLHDRGSQGFLADIQVSSPVGISWSSPHTPPDGNDEDHDDMLSLFTEFSWNQKGTPELFTNDSRVVKASSSGRLRFSATDIIGMDNLLDCYVGPTVRFVDAPWFCNIADAPQAGCDVELQYSYMPGTCKEIE